MFKKGKEDIVCVSKLMSVVVILNEKSILISTSPISKEIYSNNVGQVHIAPSQHHQHHRRFVKEKALERSEVRVVVDTM